MRCLHRSIANLADGTDRAESAVRQNLSFRLMKRRWQATRPARFLTDLRRR